MSCGRLARRRACGCAGRGALGRGARGTSLVMGASPSSLLCSSVGAGPASSEASASDGVAKTPVGVAASAPSVAAPSAWLMRRYSRYAAPAAATAPAPSATARVILVDWSLMRGTKCGRLGGSP